MEYTTPLALYDYLPVILTAVGMWWTYRLVTFISPEFGRWAAAGGALIVLGGTAKATWKLIMAITSGGMDVRWLDASLFMLMAPGFLLVFVSVWGGTRVVRGLSASPARILGSTSVIVTMATAAALALRSPEPSASRILLLGVMVVAALALTVLYAVFAARERLWLATALFAANFIGTLALNSMARLAEQSIPLQWMEQSVNSVSWLAFAVATGMVYAHARARFGVDAGLGGSSAPQPTPAR